MLRHSGFRDATAQVSRRARSTRNVSTLPQLPSLPVVASIVIGLPLALWTYKCLMMVLFQRRIIYMGYAPLGARKQRLDELSPSALDRIQCSEVELEGTTGAKLSGVFMHSDHFVEKDVEVVLVYCQGNAGNPVQRVPIFSHLCRSLSPPKCPKIGVLAIAPRSYWKSTPRRPTEKGIIQDYSDTLHYALRRFPTARIVVYGHSLGGAAAICTLAQLDTSHEDRKSIPDFDRIRGLVLENPFESIPTMVRALYPQKWLPYHYLAPLSFDKWDTLAALRSHNGRDTVLGRLSPGMLVLLSEYDEIVPPSMGGNIFDLATRRQWCGARKIVVPKALHENAYTKKTWIDEMRLYLARVG